MLNWIHNVQCGVKKKKRFNNDSYLRDPVLSSGRGYACMCVCVTVAGRGVTQGSAHG